MSKKRSWLDRIGGWILDVLPDEKKSATNNKKKPAAKKTTSKSKTASISEQGPQEKQPEKRLERKELTNKAWEKFEEAWENQGFNRDRFVSQEKAKSIFDSLETEFKDDLTEALYQLSTNDGAIVSLKEILERGKVSVGDNLTAVRSYAYIGILISQESPVADKANKKAQAPRDKSETIKSTEEEKGIVESKDGETEWSNTWDTEKNLTGESEEQAKEDLFRKEIRELQIQLLTMNTLMRSGFNTIGDIAEMSREDFLALKKFGSRSLEDLENGLQAEGLEIPIIKKQIQSSTLTNTSSQIHDPAKEKDEANTYAQWRNECLQIHQNELNESDSYISFFERARASAEKVEDPQLEIALTKLDAILSVMSAEAGEKSQNKERLINNIKLETLMRSIQKSEIKTDFLSRTQKISKLNNSAANRNFKLLVDRASGLTLAEIGTQQNPPISRERVRQAVSKISKILDIDVKDLGERERSKRQDQITSKRNIEVKNWITTLGRLPIEKDKLEDGRITELAIQAINMNLKERVDLISDAGEEVGEKEHDYHYHYICEGGNIVGNGYWQDFGHVQEFLIRHAQKMGNPSLMPKQTTLPASVRGVVTRFGGQKKVADRIGLIYQGQLVGEDGRTFWTQENLNELLDKTCQMHGLALDLMPTTGQIFEFLQTTTESKYQNKKPPSAIAALTKQGKFHWSEVAAAFNKRFVIGESQKTITLSFIKAFVRDLGEHLDSLSPSELYVLFQSQGISRKDSEKFSRTFDVLVDAIQSGVVSRDELSDWAKNNDVDSVSELLELGSEIKESQTSAEKEEKYLAARSKQIREETENQTELRLVSKDDLPSLDPEGTLRALDKAAEVIESTSSDEDKVEFLKAKATAKLWDACFKDEETIFHKIKDLKPPLDAYSAEIKESFLEEYNGSKALPIPNSYKFRDLRGNRRDPKLMQKLVAYRLQRDNQLLNLSGTGTGKTLSAIYSAQICGCKRILISCPNGVLSSWERAFNTAFPDAVIHVKLDGWQIPDTDARTHVYMVNHERFQELYAERMLAHCVGFAPDMVVIDEIHQSKKRAKDKTSQRRKLMNEYLKIAKNITPELKILGMSATPVINNLYEGRSLLELVKQEKIEDVDEKIDLNSCMNLYQHFVRSGIRMNPGSLSRTNIIIEDINATELLPSVIAATKSGSYHDLEQILVPAKIAGLSRCMERGKKTVIFITYIKNTLHPLADWMQKQKFSYCVYTGNDKDATNEGFEDALDEFIKGSTEVLIASIKCVGTGVDGLQAVCDRAVFFQLPWTSTEFEQAIGRLDRDGTEFESIKIFLPMTDIHLPNGERWSWCRSKFDRIQSKRDIAKAAVDGEVPDAASMISPSEAAKYWIGWLERLENNSA